MESGPLNSRAPRIGLDARLTRQLSVGMKTYVTELARRLPVVAPDLAFVNFERGGNFGWDEQVRLPLDLRAARLDLVHLLSIYVPLVLTVPSVITVHDLIHLRFPQYFKTKVGPYYRTVVRHALRRARRILTDDEATVGDLEELLQVDPAKVRVVALGVDDRFFDVRPCVEARPLRRYLLYVGNHRTHKNLTTLFDAWSALPETLAVDLYLTGPDDFGGDLQRRATPTRAIVALGDVPVERLARYYADAVALVQPALREGFGLPMLEAMAAGCPVVACADAVPRVLAPAALTFPARDAAALRSVLENLAGDEGLRKRFVNLGLETARPLTWDRCARATADVYREVVEEAC